MSLFASVGTYDNLDEDAPFFNHKASAFGFVITFLAITTLFASLRLYVRFFITRCPGWDDYFIILIFILTWITNVGCLSLYNVGLGQHFIHLQTAGMSAFVRMFWWVNACYNMSMAAIKLSILFQYLRLLGSHADAGNKKPKFLRLAVIFLIVITSIWGIVFSILAWVPCVPISAMWNFTNTTATRYGYGSNNINTFATTYIVHGATNMSIDIAVFSIPLFSRAMWATAGRQTQSRIAMLCLYFVGIISVICSVIRFASLVQHRATTYPAFDPTWYGPESIILSVLEVDIATIVASLPVFWPYLRRNIDRIMVTHEIEVKVTENFTQIDDQTDDLGRQQTGYSEGRRSEHNACAPWEEPQQQARHSPNASAGAGIKFGETVMMRDLGRKGGDEESGLSGGGITGRLARMDPFSGGQRGSFNGGQRSPSVRSPSRALFMSRDSKEDLLRSGTTV